MVSATHRSPPPTITVLAKECSGGVSLRQLAKELGADPSNVRKAKKWLIDNRHPTFKGYIPESSLNAAQAEAIILYRSYTTSGIKGDALTERMFPDTAGVNAKKNALRDLFQQANLAPELAARLTYSIMEIFNE
ncbi:MAG: hypothetical protein AAGN15_23860 [Cyanobacteria bacterium J06581_3]